MGAIAVGLVYQFYYSGGDTFTYFTHGSSIIWEAFLHDPWKAVQLIFTDNAYHNATYRYAARIWTYSDPASYFVVRVAGVFGILTANSYAATACLFAFFSFLGMWLLYQELCQHYEGLETPFAIALFFVPSVFFWGSGILKDTLTLGALAYGAYAFMKMYKRKKLSVGLIILLLLSFGIIYQVKIYILLCFVPALIIWVFADNVQRIHSVVAKVMITPVVLGIAVLLSFFAMKKIGEDNARYNLEKLSDTAEATAKWIYYVSTIEGGSGYTLGDFDYSTTGIIKKLPKAIWVSLYRPYLWEAHNILMLVSALESLGMLLLTLYVMAYSGFFRFWRIGFSHPFVLACLFFSISFAAAIGITTYNFGSLARYKIPMIPFFLVGLFIIRSYAKRDKAKEEEAPRLFELE